MTSSIRTAGNRSLFLMLSSAIAACGDPAAVALADGGVDAAPLTRDAAGGSSDASSLDAAPDVDAHIPDIDAGTLPPTPRRPFLVGAALRTAQLVSRHDWLAELQFAPLTLPAATAQRLAATWLKDALEEHASVAAFARFTMQLLALGAPPDLVTASQRASLDEIHHAKACFALARRYGSPAHGPGLLALDGAMSDVTLAAVAALAAEEGCVGETLGAALAREQLMNAQDDAVRRILRKIVHDEERHAALSWRFVRWAVLQGGDAVRQVVADRVEAAIEATLAMEIQSYDGIDIDAWHAHGRLTCSESRAVAEHAIRDVVRPCSNAALSAASAQAGPSRSARASSEKHAPELRSVRKTNPSASST